ASCVFLVLTPPQPCSTLFPYTTLFRSLRGAGRLGCHARAPAGDGGAPSRPGGGARVRAGRGEMARGAARAAALRAGLGQLERAQDRKSTRLNSSHRTISYAVFCLKKKK